MGLEHTQERIDAEKFTNKQGQQGGAGSQWIILQTVLAFWFNNCRLLYWV